jgi:hypothetical protein
MRLLISGQAGLDLIRLGWLPPVATVPDGRRNLWLQTYPALLNPSVRIEKQRRQTMTPTLVETWQKGARSQESFTIS